MQNDFQLTANSVEVLMKKSLKFHFIFLFALVACSPSPSVINTAIAQTLKASATETPIFTLTPISTETLPPSATTLPPAGIDIGNITYNLPSTGAGWCFTDSTYESFGLDQHLASFCAFTGDPTTFIEVIHLSTKQISNKASINYYVDVFKSEGFAIQKISFMEQEDVMRTGYAQLAMVDMTHPKLADPMYMVVAAFSVDEESYILEGKGGESNDDFLYLVRSMYDLLDSVEKK